MRFNFFALLVLLLSCVGAQTEEKSYTTQDSSQVSTFADSLSIAAMELTKDDVIYDPSYFSIAYPNGDVPSGLGVCTDVVIRAYRKLGVDLQVLVHEDMAAHFEVYPDIWGLNSTDKNIDHRRVPNLMTFFERHGESLRLSSDPADYGPGDIVTWDLAGGMTHIGIVVNSYNGERPMIVHNIGAGQVLQDCLFDYTMTGHYLFEP